MEVLKSTKFAKLWVSRDAEGRKCWLWAGTAQPHSTQNFLYSRKAADQERREYLASLKCPTCGTC